MKVVNHKELERLIEVIYDKSLSIFVHGKFGIGKSETIFKVSQKLAKKNGKSFIDWNRITQQQKRELLKDENVEKSFIFADNRASQLDVSDTRGLPNFFDDVVEWKPNLLFKVLSNPKASGIIFFDELNTAPPMIMNSLLQIVLDRCIGEISFPSSVVPIAAGNRMEDKASLFSMPMPLANRFLHVELGQPTVDGFTEYGLANGKRLDNRIIAYLHWQESKMFDWDGKTKDFAVATPRSWKFCSVLIENVTDEDEVELLASTAVGEKVASHFAAFLKLQRSVDVAEIMKNPEKMKEITELDLKWSLMAAITTYYQKHMRTEVLRSVYLICDNMETEFAMLLLRMIRPVNKEFFRTESLKLEEGDKYLTMLRDFVF